MDPRATTSQAALCPLSPRGCTRRKGKYKVCSLLSAAPVIPTVRFRTELGCGVAAGRSPDMHVSNASDALLIWPLALLLLLSEQKPGGRLSDLAVPTLMLLAMTGSLQKALPNPIPGLDGPNGFLSGLGSSHTIVANNEWQWFGLAIAPPPLPPSPPPPPPPPPASAAPWDVRSGYFGLAPMPPPPSPPGTVEWLETLREGARRARLEQTRQLKAAAPRFFGRLNSLLEPGLRLFAPTRHETLKIG